MTFVDLQAHKIAESVVKSADNHSSSYQKFLLQKKKKEKKRKKKLEGEHGKLYYCQI